MASKSKIQNVFRAYSSLLGQIKTRIREAQTRAVISVNSELIQLYWDVGRLLIKRQAARGWGASIIPKLSRDIRNAMPEVKGFSERNIGNMIRFAREYPADSILQQPVAKLPAASNSPILQQAVAKLPWGHNVLLMEKIKDPGHRR